jgi:hypothetical protein
MVGLPRVRWVAVFVALAAVLRWLGLDADIVLAAGLVIAKLLGELFAQVDAEDPMEYHTMGRSLPGFWGRVL